jgi:regulator of sigma E protease
MTTFLYILLALAVLLVLITVHEFGHYCAGKIFGFKINEFAIGFGPKVYSKTKKDGEVFSIRLLPLGGFCAFEGEDEDGKSNPDAMNNQPAWKRLIVLLSGVAFNFLFGVLTAAIYLMVSGFATPCISASINQTSFQTNDVVVSVDGKTVEAYRSFSSLVSGYKEGETFTVTVNRNGEIVNVVTSKQKYDAFYFVYDSNYFEGKLFDASGEKIELSTFMNDIIRISAASETTDGVGKGEALKDYLSSVYDSDDIETRKSYGEDEVLTKLVEDNHFVYVSSGVSMGISYTNSYQDYGFFESILKAWPFCFYLCGMILSSLGGLFTGATAVSELGGTVTAISQIAEISQMGISYFLLLLPLLAMNLALFNILPIPALDGARALFVLIEIIFRKPVNRKVEGWIHTIGLFILLGLVVFLDVYHFFFASYFLRL